MKPSDTSTPSSAAPLAARSAAVAEASPAVRLPDRAAVRALPLFAALPGAAFERLLADAQVRSVANHAPLMAEGVPPAWLHVMLGGCVELYASDGDRASTIATVRAPGHFALAAVVRDTPVLVSARACAPSRLLMLPAAAVREAFETEPAFARAVGRELADRARALVAAHRDVKLRSAVERLANRLLRYHAEQGGTGSLVLPCDKRTLASLLTMTPENLSRALKALRPRGVTVRGATIEIADPAALTALARPDAPAGGAGAPAALERDRGARSRRRG